MLKELGYDEVNLNFGCPASTVVKKLRGSGALKNIVALDEFLHGIFEENDVRISIKTRTGFYSHEEFDELLKIYEKYPVSKLIVNFSIEIFIIRKKRVVNKSNVIKFVKSINK